MNKRRLLDKKCFRERKQ